MVFAASFFGAFEITLPSSLVNKSDAQSDKGGIGGIFFMALTLVLVSFSCTGPIIGSALIQSTSGEVWTPILTMLAFSVVFALPFTLFALFPSWLKQLPKSGGWLNSVKVVLGFVELALGLKFLSVADQTYHWGLLDREVYLALWIAIFSLLGLYLLGIVVAMLTALLMRKFMFKEDETPFVMELPPYRIPTLKATMSHMWARCAQYLRKMGGMILIASIIVWFLGYFPRQQEGESSAQHYENSYIGRIGHLCEPIFAPLGLNWKASVSLLSGVAAKEIMVSTLGVLYTDEEADTTHSESLTEESPTQLRSRLLESGDFTAPSAMALLVFTLLYLPCVATIAAIGTESGWKWAATSVVYSLTVAWLCAYITYHIVQLF